VALAVDAVVIGAGVIGSSVALELSRAGMRVAVVDKGRGPGQGSTSASSAIMRFNYSTFEGVATAWESLHCWQNWSDHLETSATRDLAAYRQTGVVMLDAPIVPRDKATALFRDVGVPYEEWDTDTLAERVPAIDPGRYWPPKRIDDEAFWEDAAGTLGAVYTPDGGFIDDPLLATVNLADAAAQSGVQFLFKHGVTEVHRDAGRVAGLTMDDGGRIEASVVVNCAGPWSGRVNALAGVGSDFTMSLRPMRQEVHQVNAPPGYGSDDRPGPVIADLDLGIYTRPVPGGLMMVGGTEPACDPLEWIDDPDRVNPNRTAAVFDAQLTRAARRFPGLGVPSQPKGIAGVYDVTSDWAPVYDRTELAGFYVAVGTSGNQFKNAPVVGPMMAALIAAVEGGHDHDADPVTYTCQHTGHVINLGAFSRKREMNADSSGTVMG
jgi:sarcosine oxidase, subunit beta